MKIKSEAGKNIYFEHWSTPLDQAKAVWLETFLMIGNKMHFFFRLEKGAPNITYVMSLSRGWPIRFTEEEHAIGCVAKYTVGKNDENIAPVNSHGYQFKTWKLWGTQYIKEMDSNHALSDYKPRRNKNLFQHLIETQEEWIEFICTPGVEPKWKVYKGTDVRSLVRHYTKYRWYR